MAGHTTGGLALHRDLFDLFKEDPYKAVKELEKRTGNSYGRLNIHDIEVIKTLSFDELELLASIHNKTKEQNKPFKLS